MGLLKRRIDALQRQLEPLHPRKPMTALMDDGSQRQLPPNTAPIPWALRRACRDAGPRVLKFQSEIDPAWAAAETEFLRCIAGEDGDLSDLWRT